MAGEIPISNHHDSRVPPGSLTNRALALLSRPLTGRQLAQKLEINIDQCSRLLKRLRKMGKVRCLNPKTRRGRVYALAESPDLPVDWEAYGWVSFRHRRAVLEALEEPRQPSAIKRRARYLHPGIRMSANNVRDVIYAFVRRGIARPLELRGKAHLRYELTEKGKVLHDLFVRAEAQE